MRMGSLTGRIRRYSRSPFGAAVVGGLVVGLLGWIAIAAGWIHSSSDDNTPALATAPLPEPAAQKSSGKGLTVNQIYQHDSPGVAFIEAQSAPRPPSPLNPFGGGGGGTATGSGFVIDHEGHILTNAHVIQGADKIEVTLGNTDSSQPVSAQVVGKDPSTDIALLKVNAPSDQLHPLSLGDSSQAQVGDPVVAIGNPFGLDRTVTTGIVSALQREIKAPNGFTINNVIQTDAAINPGNSGGPLLGADGQVVGINSQIATGGGNGSVGIGFAVPINLAKRVIPQLEKGGTVQRAYLGVEMATVTSQIAKALKLPTDHGALIQRVIPGGPAAKAGLRGGHTPTSQDLNAGGDLIVKVGGKDVRSSDGVAAAIASKK